MRDDELKYVCVQCGWEGPVRKTLQGAFADGFGHRCPAERPALSGDIVEFKFGETALPGGGHVEVHNERHAD